MTQGLLFSEPEVFASPAAEQWITFICPACAYRWLGAIIRPCDEVTVETIAKRPYCPQCDQRPPMLVEIETCASTAA